VEQTNSSHAKTVTPDTLVHELEAMRDAAVRLSLAMADYQFYVESSQCADIEQVAREVISRVQAMRC